MTPEEKERLKNELINELRTANEDLKGSVASLKSEIRDEINRSAIKKQIVDEVLTKKRSRWRINWQHPAVLLLLGFVFTTACGAAITSCWKTREWDNQQSYLAAQTKCERERLTKMEEIKQKYDVKDEIITRVAETNTAAEEILNFFTMDPKRRNQEKNERISYWKEASRKWRIHEKILKQRLLLRFTDPNVSQLFGEIVSYRNLVGGNIHNQQEDLSKGDPICMPIVLKANECMAQVTEILTPRVIKMMNAEILSDEQALRATSCATDSTANANSSRPSPTAATVQAPATKSVSSNPCEELHAMGSDRNICKTRNKPH